VLLPETSAYEAMEAAARIQHEVGSLALPHAETSWGIITVSLGVASLVPSRQAAAEELVRRADAALYRAKMAGRNCIEA